MLKTNSTTCPRSEMALGVQCCRVSNIGGLLGEAELFSSFFCRKCHELLEASRAQSITTRAAGGRRRDSCERRHHRSLGKDARVSNLRCARREAELQFVVRRVAPLLQCRMNASSLLHRIIPVS
ncbi:unnamed protein product [Pylaiella littoralis]